MQRLFKGFNNSRDRILIDFESVFLVQCQPQYIKVVSHGAAVASLDLREGERFIQEYEQYIKETY